MLGLIMGSMLAAWIAIPVILSICSMLVRFWTRGESEPNYSERFQVKKYRFFFDDNEDTGVWAFIYWVAIDVVFIPLLWIGLYLALSYYQFQTVICLISLTALIFVPRFLNDMKKDRDRNKVL